MLNIVSLKSSEPLPIVYAFLSQSISNRSADAQTIYLSYSCFAIYQVALTKMTEVQDLFGSNSQPFGQD